MCVFKICRTYILKIIHVFFLKKKLLIFKNIHVKSTTDPTPRFVITVEWGFLSDLFSLSEGTYIASDQSAPTQMC